MTRCPKCNHRLINKQCLNPACTWFNPELQYQTCLDNIKMLKIEKNKEMARFDDLIQHWKNLAEEYSARQA